MKYYIGADLGTSSLKLMLVGEDGKIAASTSRSYDVSYVKDGWSEQSPADWWEAFLSGARELLAGIDASLVRGIGFGGQMHGLVVLDENDEVIRPTILWNDGRTAAEVEYLNGVIGKDALSEMTANIAFAGFTAPKILWMKNNEPDKFARIAKIMLPKDYMNYKLTGSFVTDYSDASGMLLLDVENKCWSKRMLDICSVTENMLPRLCESFDEVGCIKSEIADKLGLPHNVKVVAGAGDNAAAAIGTATVGEGRCNISLGTSGTVFISSEKFSSVPGGAIHSFCHADGGYHLMGCILSAASCNKWLCETIYETDNYSAEFERIKDESLGVGNVFFLPYLMGERSPINDTDARGVFIGMTPATKREDMLLAVMEGVSFAIKDNIEAVKALGVNVSASTLCGGGAKSEIWRRILASILDLRLDIPLCEEGPGYGGAILAMVADGVYGSVSEAASAITGIKNSVYPDEKLVKLYAAKYEKFKKIYPAMKQLFKEIKE